MQKQRHVHGWSAKETAAAFGCSPSHITRVEQGSRPSRELVQFYDVTFEAEGLFLSLFEVVVHAAEQERRRVGGRRARYTHGSPGDASTFVKDTVPHGSLMSPGEIFLKTWWVCNSGSVEWRGRQLERQGPLTGPGLITSARHVPVPETQPGKTVAVVVPLKAPTYECSSIGYFKTLDEQGNLAFPDSYQLGLDVLILVRGQLADLPPSGI